nr:putative T6SS immunity periplasmic lipoprotein [Rosenbergiella australiborealis]
MIDRKFTTVSIKDKQVCVVSPLEPQQRITAIQINSDTNDSLHEIFDDKPIYVPKGECLHVFGFRFRFGVRYNVAYGVQSKRSAPYLVIAEFSYPKE